MKRIVGIICVISAFLVVLCGCSTDRSAPVVSFYSVYRDTAQSNDERLAHLEHHFSELEVKVSEIKSDCLNSYNRYQDSTIGFLMLFGVLITVVVAVVGVVAPLLFNKQIEREFNAEIKKLRAELSEIKAIKDEIVDVQSQIERAKKDAIQTAEKQAEKIARASRWFTIAYTSTDLNLKIKLYSQTIELLPEFAEAYANRGNAYINVNKYSNALDDYSQAIKINPGKAPFYFNRGYLYRLKGENEKAVSDFTRALEIDPHVEKYYRSRGIVYGKLAASPNLSEEERQEYLKKEEADMKQAEKLKGNRPENKIE